MQETSVTWTKALAILDEGAVKRYCKQLNIADVEEPHAKIQLALVDWFSHLNIFSDGTIVEIMKALEVCTEGLAYDIQQEEVPVFTVAICDSRWISCSTKNDFFDAEIYEDVEELPEYGVTHIMCDVVQLYSRMEYRAAKIQQGGQNAATETR
jgi:hypothetical protein